MSAFFSISRHLLVFFSVLLFSIQIYAAAPPKLEGPSPAKFQFALMGDYPYLSSEETAFPHFIQEVNQTRPAFIVHDGDIKNGISFCSDDIFKLRLQQFQKSQAPFIFVFGDNEWTDCHRFLSGNYDPVERLNFLRQLFTATNESLGINKIKLTRQGVIDSKYAAYRENVYWIYGGVLFAGLNVPGSNNNYGRSDEANQEYFARNQANLAWLEQIFQLAKQEQIKAIMIIIQANLGFQLPRDHKYRTGFNDFVDHLTQHVLNTSKNVVLVHGDTHHYRVDQPLKHPKTKMPIKNFTRVETFGSPAEMNWVNVTVDVTRPEIFTFKPGRPLPH